MLATLLSGFLLGFAGSVHCVGMCGPLSMALPFNHFTAPVKLLAIFLYQAGRVVTYSILGLVFGIFGRGIYIAGFQQWFSVIVGLLVLVFAFIYFMEGRYRHFMFANTLYNFLSRLVGKIIRNNSGVASFFLLGTVNGLLPCGMVYIALISTLSFYHLYQATGFMAMFGAGTLPAMMLVAYSGQFLRPSFKKLFIKSIPVFIALTGLLLIMRGLNLGIAFISPHISSQSPQAIICHKPGL